MRLFVARRNYFVRSITVKFYGIWLFIIETVVCIRVLFFVSCSVLLNTVCHACIPNAPLRLAVARWLLCHSFFFYYLFDFFSQLAKFSTNLVIVWNECILTVAHHWHRFQFICAVHSSAEFQIIAMCMLQLYLLAV